MDITVETHGGEAVVKSLGRLQQVSGRREVRRALSKAGQLIASDARVKLSSRLKGTGRGRLSRSVTSRVKRRKPGALAGFIRSTRMVQYGVAGNHAHLVDRGTRERAGRGKMPANWFWTDAVADKGDEALRLVAGGVKAAMDEIMGGGAG